MSAYRKPAEREPEPPETWGERLERWLASRMRRRLAIVVAASSSALVTLATTRAFVPHPLPEVPKGCRIEPFYKGDFDGSYCEPGQTLDVVDGMKVCQCPKVEVLP